MALLALNLGFGMGCGLDLIGNTEAEPGVTEDAGAPNDAATNDGAVATDAPVDAPVYGSDACTAWHHPHSFDPCSITTPSPAITLPPNVTITYNTDLPGFVEDPPADPPATTIAQKSGDAGGGGGGTTTPAVLISVDGFTIPQGTTLLVIGAKPLIIASWNTIVVDGTIDVGSSFATQRSGAGANPATCAATRAVVGVDDSDQGGGSGGGGGGAFGGSGGKGGPGDTGGQNAGGDGGVAITITTPPPPIIVRGGCSGAASGKAGTDPSVTPPSDLNTTSPGGAGGGAIQLSARQSITIGATGRVLAGGSGGGGAPLHSAVGGGGGGSGGYVAFDAPMYSFAENARIAANGGGGGSSNGFANVGQPGSDGTDNATAALGGAAGTCATVGASGGAGATVNGPSAPQTAVSCGGGGGGGSVGYIVVFAATFPLPNLVSFSPLPTVVQ